MKSLRTMDYNPEMSFDATKTMSLFRSFYEELGRKFIPWTDEVIAKSWHEISNEHDDVRSSQIIDEGETPPTNGVLGPSVYW